MECETAQGGISAIEPAPAPARADGKLQAPRHEIAEAESGNIIESKLTAVVTRVEEVTGMDFERFTRSMLLAQGGFDVFLQATPDKRAPILEQITGTGIYSRISMKVHERTTEERKRLETMRDELGKMQMLSPEEEAGLRDQLAEKEGQEKELTVMARAVSERKAWAERIAALEDELSLIEKAWRSFAEKRRRRPRSSSCWQRETGRSPWTATSECLWGPETAGGGTVRVTTARQRLPKALESLRMAAGELEKIRGGLQNRRTEQERGAELIRGARELDVKLGRGLVQIKGLELEIGKIRSRAMSAGQR